MAVETAQAREYARRILAGSTEIRIDVPESDDFGGSIEDEDELSPLA